MAKAKAKTKAGVKANGKEAKTETKAEEKKTEEKNETNTEKIVKREPNAMTKMGPTPKGFEDYTDDDIIMPRMSIVQSNSDAAVKMGHQAGQFYNNITGEAEDEIRVTAMTYKKGCVRFNKPYKRGEQPSCRSNDALVPDVARVEKPFCDRCHEKKGNRMVPICPEAQWTKSDDGKRVPPRCNLTHNVVMVDETLFAFFLAFRSSSLRPWKTYLSRVWQKRKPLFAYSVLLKTTQVEDQNGIYFVPTFSDLEEHEDLAVYDEAFDGLTAMDLQKSFDDDRNQEDLEEGAEPDTDFNPDEIEAMESESF